MVNAKAIAASIAAKKKPVAEMDALDSEEGSPAEEESEPAEDAAAEGDDEADMGDYDSIEDSAVEDIMNSKDPATVKAALRDFVRACMDRGEEE